MEVKVVTQETWLTRPARRHALDLSLALLGLLFLGSYLYLSGLARANEWMPASREAVFGSGQYWRLWTTLFAHADLGHILGNAFLFLPFSFFLTGYFHRWFFPFAAILIGGLIIAIVLGTMPPAAQLIGFSGVVYWMGAAWLTLYLKIERREKWSRRYGKAILIVAAIFIPETFKPEVSHLSHLLGFLFGWMSALAYYHWLRADILSAEKKEWLFLEENIAEEEWNQKLS